MKKLYHLPFLFFIGVIFGIGLGSWLEIANMIIWLLALFGLLASGIFFLLKKSLPVLAGIFIVGACLGLLVINQATIQLDREREVDKITQEKVFLAKVISEKDEREKYSRYLIQSGKDKILLTTNKYDDYAFGEEIFLKGKLETPTSTADFDYQGYLAKDGIYLTMAFPEIEQKGQDNTSIAKFYRIMLGLKSQIRSNLIKNFPVREADFVRALILGDKGTLGQDLRQAFSRTGTSHVIAISGLHLSILTIFMFNILLGLGLWRKHATVITIIFLLFFLLFIGPIASLLRSAFMAIIALVGLSSGKIFQGERVLTYAAFIMLLQNPLLLRYDVGFELSYLAVLGMFVFKPPFDRLFQKFHMPKSINDTLTTTLAAQVLTLPIIISNFHIFSLIAPFVNLVILFLFPLILGASFLWAILSLLFNVSLLTIFLYPLFNATLNFTLWTGSFSFAATTLNSDYQLAAINICYYLFCGIAIVWWKRFYRKNLTPLAKWNKKLEN